MAGRLCPRHRRHKLTCRRAGRLSASTRPKPMTLATPQPLWGAARFKVFVRALIRYTSLPALPISDTAWREWALAAQRLLDYSALHHRRSLRRQSPELKGLFPLLLPPPPLP